ncbi:MAG: enoyl-CoA hydratase/isomerase family protein [bacterium]
MNNFIKVKKNDNYAIIVLNKPPLNILNIEDLNYLNKMFEDLSNDKDLKLLVLKAEGKAFSAGVSITDHSLENTIPMIIAFHKVFFTLLDLQIPLLSVVKGGCYGGGAELALFSDFVIASEQASFSHSEITLGCFPPVSMVLLPYLTSNKKAIEYIFTGDKINAQTAYEAGLVNHIFKEDTFDEEVNSFIEKITKNSRSVLSLTLKTFKNIHLNEFKEKLIQAEKAYLEELLGLEDYKEGISSFIEKRKPEWKNS